MKEGIHPNYVQAKIHCACGTEVDTFSTKEKLSIEICSSCHPFYSGKQRLIDTAGRIEKFKRKYGK